MPVFFGPSPTIHETPTADDQAKANQKAVSKIKFDQADTLDTKDGKLSRTEFVTHFERVFKGYESQQFLDCVAVMLDRAEKTVVIEP